MCPWGFEGLLHVDDCELRRRRLHSGTDAQGSRGCFLCCVHSIAGEQPQLLLTAAYTTHLSARPLPAAYAG